MNQVLGTLETVSPDQAREILSDNPVRRRPANQPLIDSLVAQMGTPHWDPYGRAHVVFGQNQQLMDGRMVLEAIVAHDRPVQIGIERGRAVEELTVRTAPDLSLDALTGGLRRTVRGNMVEEAAVEMLIAHGYWLRHNQFRHYLVLEFYKDNPLVHIDWLQTHGLILEERLKALPSATMMLRLACGMAKESVADWSMTALCGMGSRNMMLVMQALARLLGWHEDGRSAWVTGGFADEDLAFDRALKARNK